MIEGEIFPTVLPRNRPLNELARRRDGMIAVLCQ